MRTGLRRYQALLETQDAGQQPRRGGLLYAKYGGGVYVYNAYAFYRQLPEGVPEPIGFLQTCSVWRRIRKSETGAGSGLPRRVSTARFLAPAATGCARPVALLLAALTRILGFALALAGANALAGLFMVLQVALGFEVLSARAARQTELLHDVLLQCTIQQFRCQRFRSGAELHATPDRAELARSGCPNNSASGRSRRRTEREIGHAAQLRSPESGTAH